MNKTLHILVASLLFVSTTRSQEQHTGYSKPGSIGTKTEEVVVQETGTGLICSISIEDPSDDLVLEQDETIKIKVLVRNFTETRVRPKLEILTLPEESQRPSLKIVWLTQIQPGDMVTYNEIIKWRQNLTPGTFVYKFRAFDPRKGLTSEPIETSFRIQD
jgi:hypothetical protein